MTAETLSFQAEVSRLLDIVANSLYSHKEIFLRELISNASDACDRLRYLAIAHPDLIADDPEFRIRITAEKAGRRLTITDNGIGMNHDELIENLGTIAQSGTAAFVAQLEGSDADVSQIGQFGVGFYSAFMVAEKVEVTSRKAGEDQVWSWRSDGKGSYEVAESDRDLARGTEIALTLKKGEEGFLAPDEIRRIVTTYSDHIAIPIVLAGGRAGGAETTLNQASALWTRPKSEIGDEQYREFYHHVGHGFDDPWMHLHFKAEGVIEYCGLLFVPSSRPFDLFHPERQHQVKLYVKRVFITDDCAGLVPPYLRFLRGVIDTEDLPLNVSREMLQTNPLVAKIRGTVVKRVLSELKRKAEKAPEDYATFWNNFGAVLKEGLYEDESHRAAILELARFHSTGAPAKAKGDGTGTPDAAGGLISLKDYVARMREGQQAIYYISGDALDSLRRSPQLEGFRAKGVEVLLLTDPVDDFWLSAVPSYDGKPFKSVTRGATDLDGIKATGQAAGGKTAEGAAEPPAETANLDSLIAFVKLTLKDKVKDVRLSKRLTESPVCLVADEGDLDMHLERMLKQHRQIDQASRRILEVNPGHPLICRLAERVEAGGSAVDLEDAARLLLDQALILEGEPPPDPLAFTRRLSHLVSRGLASG